MVVQPIVPSSAAAASTAGSVSREGGRVFMGLRSMFIAVSGAYRLPRPWEWRAPQPGLACATPSMA